ncbi:hypothetical protein FJY63_15185, partial [Candidatus Sumerlaeota bacterium]|nr:hypothetical protein [Candidatus Sumerlaeota bacterium]
DSGDVGVVDVADPAAPRYIPHGDRGRFLTLDQYGGDVTIADGILYVVGTQGKSRTYDISNAASPVFIGEFPHGRSLEIMDNRWVFLTGGTNYGLEAYLLTDARDVVRVGFVGADVDGVATSNGVVCTASESDGIQLLRFPSLRQPDIVPRGFALTTTTLASGQALGFQGMVVNAGSAATTQSFWVVFAGNPIGVGGPAIALCDSLFVPAGLAPGQSVNLATITRTLYGPADGVVPDNYRVQVIVDERAQVAEIHEDNNTAQAAAELTVLASPNDLRPIEFLFLPESVRGGETITLSGQVEYTGTQTTTRGFWLEFWCSPNADLSPPQYFLCDPLFVGPGVTPGTVYPFLISPTVRTPQQGLPAGSYVVALWVDRSDHIVEKNETNNQLWRPALRLLVGEPLTKARSWELYR